MSSGLGMELMEMCLPVVRAGAAEGYLVATYALPGLLSELTNKALLRNRGLAFTEFDSSDVVRHPLVAKIVRAYDARDGKDAETGPA